MRHRVAGRKFDRNSSSRKALLRNLVSQLFQYDRIVTTEARAKEVRGIAEKIITKAKREDVHSHRQVLRVVTDKKIVKRLFDNIILKLVERNTGGYTRIIKLGNRKGDDAPMVLLEILEPGIKQSKLRRFSKKKETAKDKSKGKKETADKSRAEQKITEDKASVKTDYEKQGAEATPEPLTSADTKAELPEKHRD